MQSKEKSIIQNTTMLMLMNIAKLLFPLVTLPYLTRVLSTDTYGIVSYVKAVMTYMQVFVDFGFLLSATKNIVEQNNDLKRIGKITGDVIIAKLVLAVMGLFIVIVLCTLVPILKSNIIFVFLSYFVIVLSIFLCDFLFRGIEKMHIITKRFVLMKAFSMILTFVVVKNDGDIIWIPILDILSSVIAILLVVFEIRKLDIIICFTFNKGVFLQLKDSAVYFLSSMASLSFGALNTLILGIMLTTTDIAYWSVCLQIITAVQSLYSPIIDGVYPAMVKTKSLSIIKKELMLFMPLISLGCVLAFFLAPIGLQIVGGIEYINATPIFRCLIPVLFFGFPGMLLGWPVLGAIGKEKYNTLTTIISVFFQIAGLFILIMINQFTVLYVAILRSLTEILMFLLRMFFCFKFKHKLCE